MVLGDERKKQFVPLQSNEAVFCVDERTYLDEHEKWVKERIRVQLVFRSRSFRRRKRNFRADCPGVYFGGGEAAVAVGQALPE